MMNNLGYYPTPKSPDMASSRTATIYDQHNPQSAARDSPQQQSLPTPPSATASSNSTYSPDGQFKVVRKRNRVPLSCAPCRNRKLKCNRTSPCENCVKRGDSMSCSYAQQTPRKRQASTAQANRSPDDMQNRIDRLEGLVLTLMTNGSQTSGTAAAARALSMDSSEGSMQYPQDVDIVGNETNNGPQKGEGSEESETDQVVQSLGVMRVDNNKSMYIGDAHWAAILSDISEVKNYFAEHKKQLEDQVVKVQAAKARMDSTETGPMFLFGGGKVPEYSEILAQMPKRTVTDKLITRYFNSYDPAVHILHPPTWYRIYDKHWEKPEASGPAWLGQMFALLCLAMNSYNKMDDEPPEYRGKTLALAAHYRALTGQCLLIADFTKPVNHTIETMVLHLHCEYARSRDAEIGVWVLVGMIVRLAMRMGYHRDPKFFSNITPFQGELRRRVWTFVRQSDLLFSFQVGLPSMIREGDCDTELPRNLFDGELSEDLQELPPSRPATEPTPVSYMCTKAKLTFAFGKVVERLHLVTNCTYDDIMELDRSLRSCLAEIPPHLRMRSIDESAADPGALVMQRFNLSILYHKGQCVLHRKFLNKARANSRYAHSRRTCIDSSMELLSHQATLHYESRPGHRLSGMKVFISSLTAADFLLAAMIVSLDLGCGADSESAGGSGSEDVYTWGSDRRSDMIRALEVSLEIWKETSDQSMEAYKASTVLTVMLNKMRTSRSQQGRGAQAPFPLPVNTNGADSGQVFSAGPTEEKPEQAAALTLGLLSNGGMGNAGAAQFNGNLQGPIGDTQMGNAPISSGLSPGFGMDQMGNGMQQAANPFNFFTGAMLPGMDVNGVDQNIDWDSFDQFYQNFNIDPPLTQPTESQPTGAPPPQQPQQPWPASVDPSLANAALDGQPQANTNAFNAPNAYMGGNVPL